MEETSQPDKYRSYVARENIHARVKSAQIKILNEQINTERNKLFIICPIFLWLYKFPVILHS